MTSRIFSRTAACFFLSLWVGVPVLAQENQAELQPLPEEIAARFDQIMVEIDVQKRDMEQLTEREAEFEGPLAEILGVRRDRIWISALQNTVGLATEIANQQESGSDIAAYSERLVTALELIPAEARAALQRLKARTEYPTEEMAPQEFVVADQRLFTGMRELDNIFRTLIDYVEVADRFGLESADERAYIADALIDSGANRSIFLELALSEVATLRATVATLPDNKNLADWLSAAETRVQLSAKSMQDVIALMNSFDLETSQYRQQVLTVTGEITTDVLDVDIVASLLSEWITATVALMGKEGPKVLFRLLLVLLILFVFFQLAKMVQKGVSRALGSARVSMSSLLRTMIVSSVRNLVMMVGILIAISQLGVSLGPLLAGLGIAGFIIGFALQDSLSNFASGMMILMYRPFDVGDVVDAGGVRGKVNHMSLVNTTFMTLDNQRLIVPNNLIWQSVITNVTAQHTRRIDLVFGIAYEDDIDLAERVLRDVVEAHDAVLDDPELVIRLHELGESSVNFIVRPWVKTSDYWDTYWDLMRAVKVAFDKEGISIPFPQRDIHVIEQKPA
jgi:small conductance mechanosensitive channel